MCCTFSLDELVDCATTIKMHIGHDSNSTTNQVSMSHPTQQDLLSDTKTSPLPKFYVKLYYSVAISNFFQAMVYCYKASHRYILPQVQKSDAVYGMLLCRWLSLSHERWCQTLVGAMWHVTLLQTHCYSSCSFCIKLSLPGRSDPLSIQVI